MERCRAHASSRTMSGDLVAYRAEGELGDRATGSSASRHGRARMRCRSQTIGADHLLPEGITRWNRRDRASPRRWWHALARTRDRRVTGRDTSEGRIPSASASMRRRRRVSCELVPSPRRRSSARCARRSHSRFASEGPANSGLLRNSIDTSGPSCQMVTPSSRRYIPPMWLRDSARKFAICPPGVEDEPSAGLLRASSPHGHVREPRPYANAQRCPNGNGTNPTYAMRHGPGAQWESTRSLPVAARAGGKPQGESG